jgi:DNA replication and repair protein RecF
VRVRALRQLHFRNLDTHELLLPDGVTCVVGRNAAGKSNLIDALYLACTAQLASGTVAQTLRFGSAEGFVSVELLLNDEVRRVSIGLTAGRKSVRIDEQLARSAEVARLGGAVRIAPEDAALIHGPPAVRRGFLDDLLSRLSLRYALVLRGYHRVVEQRNAVLRDPSALATISVWDSKLLELGREIDSLRTRVLTRLAPLAANTYRTVASDSKGLSLTLSRAAGDRELAEALSASRAEERARGVTLVGPHRDDLSLTLDGREVRNFGSRGEARTAALALRVAEFALLEERHQTPPLLLIDDIAAELDADRRSYLLALARRTPQALVTGTEAPTGADRVWRIHEGTVTTADG